MLWEYRSQQILSTEYFQWDYSLRNILQNWMPETFCLLWGTNSKLFEFLILFIIVPSTYCYLVNLAMKWRHRLAGKCGSHEAECPGPPSRKPTVWNAVQPPLLPLPGGSQPDWTPQRLQRPPIPVPRGLHYQANLAWDSTPVNSQYSTVTWDISCPVFPFLSSQAADLITFWEPFLPPPDCLPLATPTGCTQPVLDSKSALIVPSRWPTLS